MARELGDQRAKRAIKKDKDKIEQKRKVTGDPEWKPVKGAGMMTERDWKKYQPDSKTPKDYVEEAEEEGVSE